MPAEDCTGIKTVYCIRKHAIYEKKDVATQHDFLIFFNQKKISEALLQQDIQSKYPENIFWNIMILLKKCGQ